MSSDEAASLALALQLAQEEARSPAKAHSPAKIEINLCTPEERRPKRAKTAAPATTEQLTTVAAQQQMPAFAHALSAFNPQICTLATVLPVQHENWTCGYANLGALLQCLSRAGRQRLPSRIDPPALQALIERAWQEGFDPEGRAEFGGRLVGKHGRCGWIGAAEMAAVLWHLRVDAIVVEVDNQAGNGRRSGTAVFEAVRACLAPGRWPPQQRRRGRQRDGGVTSLPIILQGDGHSRTVLGVTTGSAASPSWPALVLRDPRNVADHVHCETPRELDGESYQLVVVLGDGQRRLSEAEARSRMGEPKGAALWRQGKWKARDWCPLMLP